jgi:hypothetical protein
MNRLGHVECVGKIRGRYKTLAGKHEGRRPLGSIGVNVRIILKWVLKKYDLDSTSSSGYGPLMGSSIHGN